MRMTRIALFTGTACVIAGAGTAHGQVMSIGEFIGDASEGFENIIAPGPYSGQMPILNGGGTMDDQFTDPWITTVLSDPNNSLFPYDGNLMGLTPTGQTLFEFSTPVNDFGGYFGMLSQGISGGSVTFYDEAGGEIESLPLNIPYNEWTWMGWHSDTPIGSIEMDTGANPGVPTVYDNLQISIPAPGALALFAVGACTRRRRRR